MFSVFLLLGSNLGHRQLLLQEAVAGIGHNVGTIVKQSSVYETQAWGKTNQPDYLNQVVIVKTNLTPREVLKSILQIELNMGRERKEKWGERIIDIDILFYEDMILTETDLIIPHPELQNRRFTLAPLAQIAPDWVHPVLNKSMFALNFALQDCLIVKKL